jgi:hypothetical protein
MSEVGVRIYGEVESAPTDATDGIVEVRDGRPDQVVYCLMGVAGEATNLRAGTAAGIETVGAEFVLTIDTGAFQVQTDQRVHDLPPRGSRVMVTGKLTLVGDYEWEAFELADTRDAWHVRATAVAASGDEMLDLVPPAQAHGK